MLLLLALALVSVAVLEPLFLDFCVDDGRSDKMMRQGVGHLSVTHYPLGKSVQYAISYLHLVLLFLFIKTLRSLKGIALGTL